MVILLMFYDIGFATSIWLVGNDYRYPGMDFHGHLDAQGYLNICISIYPSI